jgi:hypothetical protein
MTVASDTNATPQLRWGEALVLASAAPGGIAAAVLGLGLALDRLGWQLNFGPVTPAVAWIAVASPGLVILGSLTLIGGVLAASRVPGRPGYKWGILFAGTLAWGAAAFWLSVPGLVDLP